MKITAINKTQQQQKVFYKPMMNSSVINFKANPALIQPEPEELSVFSHHIYSLNKGIRPLILMTEKSKKRKVIEERLERKNIPYLIHEVTKDKINVYMGDQACIDVVSTFDPNLTKLTPEQDFMLGTLLGYDKLQECQRYKKHMSKIES